MIEQDTVRLLSECDAGVKMGIDSIEEVLDRVESKEMKSMLTSSRDEHERLGREIGQRLADFHDSGKDPSPIARGMSWMKTNMKLAMNSDDKTVASLITDGCDMGVKSLSRYLNEYKAADERSKDIAKKLISMEASLSEHLRGYL